MLHVRKRLYRRLYHKGMMTENWPGTPIGEAAAGQREAMHHCRSIIDRVAKDDAELRVVYHALSLMAVMQIRTYELHQRVPALISIDTMIPNFGREPILPEGLEKLDTDAQGWIVRTQAALLLLEANHARSVEDWETTARKAGLAAALDPNFARAQRLLGNSLLHLGQHQAALVAAHRARLSDPKLGGVSELIHRCLLGIRREAAASS